MGSTPDASKRYERLAWATIVRRFPDQWVIVMSLDWASSSGTEIESATVVAHGTSREDALDAALPMLRHYGGEFACVYTARQILRSRPDGRPAGRA